MPPHSSWADTPECVPTISKAIIPAIKSPRRPEMFRKSAFNTLIFSDLKILIKTNTRVRNTYMIKITQ